MKVVTAGEMGRIDRATIARGTPGIELMRTAGKKVFDSFVEKLNVDAEDRIVVICGKGNNGGDGFRVATMLRKAGLSSSVFLLGTTEEITGNAATCMHEAQAEGQTVIQVVDETKMTPLRESIEAADIIVDAVFGTGFHGEVTGVTAHCFMAVNDSNAVVVSVDMPSGVNATDGSVAEHAIAADITVTFGCLKAGHVLLPGRRYCGEIHCTDIGFDPEVIAEADTFCKTLVAGEARDLLPRRSYDAHKGNVGKVMVVAGSAGMTGAAAMSGKAALRMGAGLVTIGCPESLNDILEVKCTEILTIPLPEVRKKRCLALRAMGALRERAADMDCVAVGPGLGNYHETAELLRRFVLSHAGALVLDADAVTAFAGRCEMLLDSPAACVLTPHPGEMAKLLGTTIADVVADSAATALEAARRTGAVVVLKGAPTVIASPSGESWINMTGNEGMATAGMGDVLTGIMTALRGQGLKALDAAVLGVYIHGRAGDMAVNEYGVHGLTAGDVLSALPAAIIDILNTT